MVKAPSVAAKSPRKSSWLLGTLPWYLLLGIIVEHSLFYLLSPNNNILPATKSKPKAVKPSAVVMNGFCIGKEGSKQECGEDAWMMKGEGDLGAFLAVADGVGGWSMHGGDSSVVSQGLLKEWKGAASLSESLTTSVGKAMIRMNGKGMKSGSTTLTAAQIDLQTGKLSTLNIGDSELIVVREGKTVFRTEIGLFGFNAPLQVGFDEAGRPIAGIVESQRLASFDLQAGDLILAASDGLFDNIFPDELDHILPALLHGANLPKKLTSLMRSKLEERLQSVAKALCHYAHARSHEQRWSSPFTQAAVEAKKAGPDYLGGKHDDVSVIVAMVV